MRQARTLLGGWSYRIINMILREEEDLAWQRGIGCGGYGGDFVYSQ